MTDIEIMEQNLAKLLNQHSSLPQLLESQPADPFQKRQFGKKLKKSNVNHSSEFSNHIATNYNSNSYSNDMEQPLSFHMSNLNGKRVDLASYGREEESKYYCRGVKMEKNQKMKSCEKKEIKHQEKMEQVDGKVRQIQSLFNRLKIKLDELEQQYIQKGKKIYKDKGGKNQSQDFEEFIGNLEGSIEFIIKDCLVLREKSSNSRLEIQQKRKKMQNDKQNCRGNSFPEKHRLKGNESRLGEKSIYESVLQDRQKRSKKRMI